jgi:hypothetical protein
MSSNCRNGRIGDGFFLKLTADVGDLAAVDKERNGEKSKMERPNFLAPIFRSFHCQPDDGQIFFISPLNGLL